MLLPATPGWVSLPVVVGVPRHSWLRVSGAAPRPSWLGFAGRGGGCFCGWGSPVLCVLVARRMRVVHVLVCVVCVCGVCVGGGVGVGAPSACVCVCVCVRVWSVGGVRCGAVWCVGGGVAGVWCDWSLATPGGGSCVLLPATSGWVSLPVVVGVRRHSWLRAPAVVVCGSPPLLAGACQLWCRVLRVGVSLVVCVWGVCGCARWPCCVVSCVFVVFALLVVWCGGAVGVSSACASVRGCVCEVCRWSAVWCPHPFWLALAPGVCVVVVGVWFWSPATSG